MKLTFQERCFRDMFRSYRYHQKEIKKLTAEIESLKAKQGKLPTVKIKVKSSMDDWPFIETSETVEAVDPVKNLILERRIWERERVIKAYFKELEEVDNFILGIDDELTRKVFELHYYEGISQTEIAAELHYTQGYINQLIMREFKHRQKSNNL